MNKVKKCLVSILSVVLLIVSLAGCSSKSPSDLNCWPVGNSKRNREYRNNIETGSVGIL